MSVRAGIGRHVRSAVVAVVLLSALLGYGFFWKQTGGKIPRMTDRGYKLTAVVPDIQNLAMHADLVIAGIPSGKVRGIARQDDGVRLSLQFDDDVAPLHEGMTLRLSSKTLIAETYVEVVDGTGPPLPSGATLPPTAALPNVRLEEVLQGLEPQTRAALSSLIQRLDRATAERGGDLSAVLAGLGRLGDHGHDALDVLAAQSDDLKVLTAQTAQLLSTLDAGEGRLTRLIEAADHVSRTTSARADQIESAVKLLPGVLNRAKAASGPLRSISGALLPLASPLQAAAPDLSAALTALPTVTKELQAIVPPLDATLDRAPATLTRVPPLAADLRTLVPPVRTLLGDLNPMLAYLAPYAPDVTAALANGSEMFGTDPGRGRYLRVGAHCCNEWDFADSPAHPDPGPVGKDGLWWRNPYPRPGASGEPQPSKGEAPRVDEEPTG